MLTWPYGTAILHQPRDRARARHPRGENVVDWVRKQGQKVFGEDWHVHEYIVGALLTLAGAFFTFMAFAMYAGAHDWWVLKWL
jgi:hypothetical protein